MWGVFWSPVPNERLNNLPLSFCRQVSLNRPLVSKRIAANITKTFCTPIQTKRARESKNVRFCPAMKLVSLLLIMIVGLKSPAIAQAREPRTNITQELTMKQAQTTTKQLSIATDLIISTTADATTSPTTNPTTSTTTDSTTSTTIDPITSTTIGPSTSTTTGPSTTPSPTHEPSTSTPVPHVTEPTLGNYTATKENGNLTQFEVGTDKFYKCAKASEVDMGNSVHLIFSDMKYEAFRTSKTADFTRSEQECVSDYHSDVVIIAIGCALALLVVIILVAYVIARRQNRQRGYQSV
ncbi:lysosome-associated membrane glycoprotein 1-like [Tropilaelaps mercedesae]|uniref:Lysosome-associated membrane glycoprotein 1-like n=1 Tax=Tropilaelaps mercedesae TaxID=418985 RepID=A0A1V9XAJ1_9ACAR|nr:lysosome-associated membrane glycoprotein 1-like [Tropilaelaps mercedesae]